MYNKKREKLCEIIIIIIGSYFAFGSLAMKIRR